MTSKQARILAISAVIVGLMLWGLFNLTTLRGVVLAAGVPVAGAVVRVQGTANSTFTDSNGGFALPVPPLSGELHVTAWASGYFISHAAGSPPSELTLTLRAHPTADNPEYTFVSPVLDPTAAGACGRCHAAGAGTVNTALPVDEWLADAHAQSAVNPRFLSLYNGTTPSGAIGTPTQYRFDVELGIDVPVLASSDVGFRLDFPETAGMCAACHVPILALEQPYDADPNAAEGVAAEGVTCDFCHKIAGVQLEIDGRPSPHVPGVQSLEFVRPPDEEQIFFGPYDDTPGDDVYLPLQAQSQFCAACHSGTFWGVSMYDSFGEWLASPYSDPVTGQTCQACHMPHMGVSTFVNLPPDVTQYVPERDPQTIFSHRMPGAADSTLLQATAELTAEAQRDGASLTVSVAVTNTGAGHAIPTDNPLRNLILLVEARNAAGQPLELLDGAVIPEWGGVGDPAAGYYAGLPGRLYTKLLADFYTGETPTYAYWRQTRLVSDNRIAALATDVSSYRFNVPDGAGEITVEARLFLRRAFIDLMAAKGWDTPDILMEQVVRVVP